MIRGELLLLMCIFGNVYIANGFEGSGTVEEASGVNPAVVEASGSAPEDDNSVQTSEPDNFTDEEIEILRNIRLSDIVVQESSGEFKKGEGAPSLDEEPLSRTSSQERSTFTSTSTSLPSAEQVAVSAVAESPSVIPSSTAVPSKEPLPPLIGYGKSKAEKDPSHPCKKLSVCFSDSECGGKGRCMGAFVGKCNCNACVHGRNCGGDKDCGGLEGACEGGRCGCAQVFARHGMQLYIDVLTQFCNNRDCSSPNECFGLPCNPGRCYC